MKCGLYDKTWKELNIPLKEIRVEGNLLGKFAEVSITQFYENTLTQELEVIYTFPIPETAVITELNIEVGDRTVKGVLMEKEAALKTYEKTVMKGDSAFLLENFRPNIFQLSLGNITMGEKIIIHISYLEEIKLIDNEIRFSIPTVVGPRYIPANGSVPDARSITPPIGEAPYKTSFKVKIHPSEKVSKVESPSHKINTQLGKMGEIVVTLEERSLADRDFILNITLEEEASSQGIKSVEDGGNYAYLTFVPEFEAFDEQEGKDYIFLLDISGSMSGEKLKQAKSALNICLRNLSEKDRFNIVAFESQNHYFKMEPQEFNQESLDNATKWLQNISAKGGTEILEAVRFALENRSNEQVVSLFTDGEVGNEEEIIQYVRANSKNTKIFTFGIDTAVNSYFINGLAEAGGGCSEFVYPGESIDDKVIRQFARITSGYLKSVKIDWGTNKVIEVFPEKITGAFNMEPINIIAKLEEPLKDTVTLSGSFGDEQVNLEVRPDEIHTVDMQGILTKIFVKEKIKYLERYLDTDNPRRAEIINKEIIDLSIKNGIASSLTSFVAVDERIDKLSGMPQTVFVPVALPHLWEDSYRGGPITLGAMAAPACASAPPALSKKSRGLSMSKNVNSDMASMSRKMSTLSEAPYDYMEVEVHWDVDSLLKLIARNQNADGSFGNADKGKNIIIENTVLAVVAFLLNEKKLKVYKKQVAKSVKYIINELLEGKVSYDAAAKAITALQLTKDQGLLDEKDYQKVNEKIHVTAQDLSVIKSSIQMDEEVFKNKTSQYKDESDILVYAIMRILILSIK